MARRVLIGLAAIAAVIALLLASGRRDSARAGRPAPPLPAQALAGRPVTLADLRGKPAAVNFWASWCGPCRREAPGFARLPARLGGRAHLVAVDWSDDEGSARAFVRRFAWRFPVLRDADGAAGERYGISGLPTTFILDARGRIVDVMRGPQSAAAIERRLDAVRG